VATPADVLRVAPDFTSLDPVLVIQPFLDDAMAEVDPTKWGPQADRVVTLLAAHALAIAYPNLYVRPVVSERVGDIGRTYIQAVRPGGSEYAATRFGMEYLRLRTKLGLTFAVPGATIVTAGQPFPGPMPPWFDPWGWHG